MEIPRRSGERAARLDSIEGGDESSKARRRLGEWGFVAGLILIAALLRLDFMRGGDFVIDADEAIVGLMGKHILEGRSIPTFYYGQHYMGSLEAICASLMFAVFGVSSVTLQLVPLTFSLLLVYLMYVLGRAVGGVPVGRVAALLYAVPPASLVVWSFKARGGFIELLVLGALAMLFTVRWLKKPTWNLLYPTLIWLTVGIGWWVNNQIIYFIVPIGIFGAIKSLSTIRAGRLSLRQATALSAVSISAFFVGSAPYWIYNIKRGFPSLGMFGFAPLSDMGEHFSGLFANALPIIFGAMRMWTDTPVYALAPYLVWLVYGALALLILRARRRQLVDMCRGSLDRIEPLELFIVFVPFCCLVFAVSSFGWLSQAPRYLLPMYVGLFVLCGWAVSYIGRSSKVAASALLATLLGLNLASCYIGGRAVPGEPIVFNGQRVSRDHSEINSLLEKLGVTRVRTNYWIGYRIAFETNERVTFLVFEAPKQVRIPEYEDLADPRDRFLVPLLLVPAERELYVPGLAKLGYTFKEASASGYHLLYDIKHEIPGGVDLPSTAIKDVRAWGNNDPKKGIDGDLSTRWGTGGHQRDGQTFVVEFTAPTTISQLRYNLGTWSQDFPRGLRIDVQREDGSVVTVLNPDEFRQVMALSELGELWLPIAPVKARSVSLVQTGYHPILDWSIAEIGFVTPLKETR